MTKVNDNFDSKRPTLLKGVNQRSLQRRDILTILNSAGIEIGPRGFSVHKVNIGAVNDIWKIALLDGTALYLRVFRSDHPVCEKEISLLSRSWHRKVPVPRVIASSLDGASVGQSWVLLEAMEGVALRRALLATRGGECVDLANAVGMAIAKIHDFRFEEAGLLDADLNVQKRFGSVHQGTVSFIRTVLQTAAFRYKLGRSRSRAVRQALDLAARWLSPLEGRISLVHADLNAGNVLVKKSGNYWHVSAVLDWEFAHASTPLFDLTQLIRAYWFKRRDFAAPLAAAWSTALEFPLGGEWLESVMMLDLLNLVDHINRASVDRVIAARCAELDRALAVLNSCIHKT